MYKIGQTVTIHASKKWNSSIIGIIKNNSFGFIVCFLHDHLFEGWRKYPIDKAACELYNIDINFLNKEYALVNSIYLKKVRCSICLK